MQNSREVFRGKEHLWKILLEGLKTQPAPFPSCLAILWDGDVVLSWEKRTNAQFLSVRRKAELFKGNKYINIAVTKTDSPLVGNFSNSFS